jgi:hypothetical protein
VIDRPTFFNHIAPMNGRNRMMGLIAAMSTVVAYPFAADWPAVPKPMLNGTISGNSLTRDTEVLTPVGIVNDMDFIPHAEPAAGPAATESEPAPLPSVSSPTEVAPTLQLVSPSVPSPIEISATQVMSSHGMSQAPVASPRVHNGPTDTPETTDDKSLIPSSAARSGSIPGKMVIHMLPADQSQPSTQTDQ